MKLRTLLAFIAAFAALTGCETTDSDDWIGSSVKPFNQAERSCKTQADFIAEAENRREFFIGCMRALGWTPRGEPEVDI